MRTTRIISLASSMAQMVPGVMERRAVAVHEALAEMPLQHGPAGDISFLSDIHAIP
jgi:hypothetical protein